MRCGLYREDNRLCAMRYELYWEDSRLCAVSCGLYREDNRLCVMSYIEKTVGYALCVIRRCVVISAL